MPDPYPIPRAAQILPQTFQRQSEPQPFTFIMRNFLVYKPFDEQAKEEFKKIMSEYEGWVKKEQKLKESYKISKKTEEEKDKVFLFNRKFIYKK